MAGGLPPAIVVLLPVDKLLSKVMPLSEINTGFDLLRDGSLIRGVVLPEA